MEVGFSEDISLFQLKDHPTPKQMFNDKYPFFTGSSEYMKIHFINYAKFIKDNNITEHIRADTAGSAEMISITKNINQAAIASSLSAKICQKLLFRVTPDS